MLNRIAGIHRIDSSLVSRLDAKAPLSAETRKEVKAQIWQLNAFVQAGKSLWPDEADTVMHARRTEHENADGIKVSRIELYMRPKVQGVLSFFDDLLYREERKLAADALRPLVSCASAHYASVINASVPLYQAPSWLTDAQPVSIQVNALALSLKPVADCITAELLETPGDKGPLVKQGSLRDAVREQPEFSQWNCDAITSLDDKLKETLQRVGFKPEGIETFARIARDIARQDDTGDVAMDALHEFRMHWVAKCERTDEFGANFRKTVCSNSTFRAWNVLAHHLAGRTQPRFDLGAYAGYRRVMVPDVDDMIWPEGECDAGATRVMVRSLHAKARNRGKLEFEPTTDGPHQLFAAYRRFRDSRPNQLSPVDQTYLSTTYRQFICASIDAGESFLLAPLFDYEEGTIAACIGTMLAPIEDAFKQGKRLPDIGLFSTDPRIDDAFNKGLTKLRTDARNRQNPVPGWFASPESAAAAPTGMAVSSATRTEKLRLQVGISHDQWEPDEKTLLLLTGSSGDCAQPEEATIGIELSQALASPEFSAAREEGLIFRETKHKSPWGCNNRYMAPQEEVVVEKSSWLFSPAALDDLKASEIRMAYTRVCKTAVTNGIHKLVLTPCFKETGGALFGKNGSYQDAIGVMVETLAQSTSLYPQLELTIIARSETERKLMQEAMESRKQSRS